jgi:hypothetical protein
MTVLTMATNFADLPPDVYRCLAERHKLHISARENQPGFRTILKLPTDSRFNKK